jgi:uncharacterized membrane protein
MKKLVAIIAVIAAFPALALAQSQDGNFDNVFGAVDTIMKLITMLIPIVIGAAVLLFLFGILRFVFAGSDDDRKKARGFMILGIVSLAVMVSVWGLVRFLQSTFGLEDGADNAPKPPSVPAYRGR